MKNNIIKIVLTVLLIFPSSFSSNSDKVGTPFYKDDPSVLEELQSIKSKYVQSSNVNEKKDNNLLDFLKEVKDRLVPLTFTMLITSVIAFIIATYKKALELKKNIEFELQKIDGQIDNLNHEIQKLRNDPLPKVFEVPDDVGDKISKLQEDINKLSALEEQLERDFLDDKEADKFYI